MNDYPNINPKSQSDILELLQTILEERLIDIKDFDNLNNRFIAGRKTGRIPSGATDVTLADKVGDFNIADDSGTVYLYALVDISGTAEWRRVALSSW